MATEKQFEANRQNAQKSTGPRTPEGRAAVRLNGVTHGLTAETIVLKGESEADFTNLLGSLEAEHDPVTPTEEALVVQLAMATNASSVGVTGSCSASNEPSRFVKSASLSPFRT